MLCNRRDAKQQSSPVKIIIKYYMNAHSMVSYVCSFEEFVLKFRLVKVFSFQLFTAERHSLSRLAGTRIADHPSTGHSANSYYS